MEFAFNPIALRMAKTRVLAILSAIGLIKYGMWGLLRHELIPETQDLAAI